MTVIAIIFGIAALVWGIILAVRGSLLAGCLTYLLLVCCCGVHLASFDVGGVTLSIDRVFLAGLVVAYVVQWRLGRREPKPLMKVDYALFGLFGLIVVSTFLHDWRTSGPNEVPIVQHVINGYAIPLAVYWIARQSKLDERGTTLVLASLVLFGGYLAITGIFESTGQWSFVFPSYIASPHVGEHFGRARGPMVQSVSYGVYLSACLLAAWLLKDRLPARWQLALWAIAPMFAAAIYLTKTRSVWLGAATGLFIVLALTLKGRVRVAVLGTMVLAGAVVGVWKFDAIMGMQREATSADTEKSASMRGSFTYVSWRMFQDRPIFGFGFGQFPREKLPYLGDRSVDLQLEDIRDYVHHNTFLSILTELGLVGLVLLVAVLAGWATCGWKLANSERAPPWARRQGVLLLGVLGVVFWQMLGHEITFTPLDQSLLFFVAAIAAGLVPRPAPAEPLPAAPVLESSACA